MTTIFGSTHETAEDSFIAPNSQKPLSKAPSAQISRLKAYLEEAFPDEMVRSNTQHGEAPADLAIRLLAALTASTPPTQRRRCEAPYCNKSAGHTDVHGHVEGL
jgi:hypothetical protein